jgi:hypothetical protein
MSDEDEHKYNCRELVLTEGFQGWQPHCWAGTVWLDTHQNIADFPILNMSEICGTVSTMTGRCLQLCKFRRALRESAQR